MRQHVIGFVIAVTTFFGFAHFAAVDRKASDSGEAPPRDTCVLLEAALELGQLDRFLADRQIVLSGADDTTLPVASGASGLLAAVTHEYYRTSDPAAGRPLLDLFTLRQEVYASAELAEQRVALLQMGCVTDDVFDIVGHPSRVFRHGCNVYLFRSGLGVVASDEEGLCAELASRLATALAPRSRA